MSRIQTRAPIGGIASFRQPVVAAEVGACRISIQSVTSNTRLVTKNLSGLVNSPVQVLAGSLIECQYCLSGFDSADSVGGVDSIRSIEHSVLWQSTGRGSRDFGVHFFERRKFAKSGTAGTTGLDRQSCLQPYLFRTVCPNSPLTYHGKLVAIDWLVRVRVFLASGRDLNFDQEFVVQAEANSTNVVH